jgi:hypothetical protein
MEENLEFGARRWNKEHGCYETLEDDGQETGGDWRLDIEVLDSDVVNFGTDEPDPRGGLDDEIETDDDGEFFLTDEEYLN